MKQWEKASHLCSCLTLRFQPFQAEETWWPYEEFNHLKASIRVPPLPLHQKGSARTPQEADRELPAPRTQVYSHTCTQASLSFALPFFLTVYTNIFLITFLALHLLYGA